MYKNMTELLKDGQVGNFKLEHYTINENNLYAIIRCGIPAGNYIRLTNGWDCVMSDTPMEKRTNSDFVRNAHGNVLIGGLGIGLILLAIQDKDNVEQVTVVEKNADVIELVGKQLPLNHKVTIVNADVFEYEPEAKYNTIYMDIWNYINKEIYNEQMKPLINRYRKYLVDKLEDEHRYINCWCKNQAKNGERI